MSSDPPIEDIDPVAAGEDEDEDEYQIPLGKGAADEVSDPTARRGAWAIALVVTVLGGGATTYAFQPVRAGQPAVLLIVGIAYAVLAIGTVLWLSRRDELRARLLPERGDVSIGALVGAALYMLAMVVHSGLTSQGAPGEPWIMRLYLQIGDPAKTRGFQVGLAVFGIAMAEELVWRGWVQGALTKAYGGKRGWLITAALYTVAHVGTVFALADPSLGPNPLIVAAAAGCGLIWGLVANQLGRLGPSMFSHGVFSWAIVQFPVWRLG